MTNKILARAQELSGEVSQFLADIAAIPSLSGKEKAVVERIAAEMKKVGFDKVWFDGLGSVIGQIGNRPRKIVFDAHIDTVDVGNRDLWKFDPYKSHIKDGRVWGRGVADQKGGMASMVYAGKSRHIHRIDEPKGVLVLGFDQKVSLHVANDRLYVFPLAAMRLEKRPSSATEAARSLYM